MGLRSGLIIGGILMVTIMGTFIVMAMGEITLERISLGALVIALGMLVDNAIVVTDGMKVKMQQGTDALTAARDIAGQVGVPLLGATFVAVAAFAACFSSEIRNCWLTPAAKCCRRKRGYSTRSNNSF